ncbi:MAG: hypothetical protein CM15mP63_0190 [Gammaproteobacteria bacterium]|nr:MAG: hypothetical protein CM15mP63_0190 [Gammaproteobacteria bacterium]
MTNKRNFIVKILHFKKNKVYINEIEVVEGTKVIDIIESFDRDIFEQIKKNSLSLGVFGKPVSKNYIIKDNDRVELYEPALMDAREFRISKIKKSS